jgi:hypothetical protein
MPFVACEDATKKDVREATHEVRALRKLYSRIPSSELAHEIKTAERHVMHLFECLMKKDADDIRRKLRRA